MKKQIQDSEIKLKRELAEAEIAIKLMVAEADAKISKMETDAKIAQDDHVAATKADSMKKETDMKISEQARKDEGTAMPNFLKAIEAMMKTLTEVVQGNQQFQAELVKSLNKSKTVKLGGISRRQDGEITGASATVN